jgi:Undecaprenyl-phosphate galactose phosphotransferase WbaP
MHTVFGYAGDLTIKDINNVKRVSLLKNHARIWMTFVLLTADILSLLFAGVCGISLRALIGDGFKTPDHYIRMAPLIIVFLGVYAWRGLYPAVGISPVEELRRLTASTFVVLILVTAFTFWTRNAGVYSRLAFIFSWLFALLFVQASRWIVRTVAVYVNAWGEPVAVIGYGPQGKRMISFLQNNLRFGIKPAVVIDEFNSTRSSLSPIPRLLLDYDVAEKVKLRKIGIRTGILISSEVPAALLDAIVTQQKFDFERLILISDFQSIGSLGVRPYDLEGLLGLEVRQNLINPLDQAIKRIMDIGLVTLGGLVALPVGFLIGFLIRLDSKGKALYTQDRIGKGGKTIRVWKFRTMIENAEEALDDYLNSSPDAFREWNATRKLKEDPRVTRLGRFLRRSSLDELPQLWNVFKGEMSLVGPRPIVEEEIRHYRHCFRLYTRVLPGITGMWQVSGRNNLSYDFRVRLDEYYVRNWSIWLDIYILLRTILVVSRGDGAY